MKLKATKYRDMVRSTLLVVGLVVFSQFVGNTQNVYLKYDESCMERLEYSAGAADGEPYVTYRIKLGEKKFVTLDIGKEANKWVKDLPGKVNYCQDLTLNKDLVQQVNSGKLKLHIIRESPTHYNISAVDKAGYSDVYGGVLEYAAEDGGFMLYLDNPVSGINLASPGSTAEFYLNGTISYQCLKGYLFDKKDSYRSNTYKEYVLIPEIGIVERSAVNNGSTASTANFKLSKIKETSFRDNLESICDKQQADIYDGVATSSNVPNSYDALTPRSGSGATTGLPCEPSKTDGIHVVQKGETLYGISKRYGLTVEQLQSLNNMVGSTSLSLCQYLKVKQDAQVPSNPSSPSSTTEKGGSSSTANGYWLSAGKEHQVKPGESVASLANLYGYTEARFRKMNGLAANEQLRAGQWLHTSDCICPTLESSTKNQPLPYEQESEKLTHKSGAANNTPPDVYYRPIKVHLVKNEETLFGIAKLYNTTVDRILELNGMKQGDKISPNQKIYVQ